MRKILIILLCFISLEAFGVSAYYSPSKPVSNPLKEAASKNSILNVQSGIEAHQNDLKSQFFPVTKKPSVPAVPVVPAIPVKPVRPVNPFPPVYTPMIYGVSYPDKKEQVNINNTYNIYQAPSAETSKAPVKQEEKKEEIKPLTQSQKDEIERQKLKKRYSSILSNKTMSNDKMCSKMADCFKDADYDELERVLNHILRLNCDIGKFR